VSAVTEEDIDQEAKRWQEQKLLLLEQIIDIVKGGSSSITAHAASLGQTPATATAMLLWSLAKRAERGIPTHQKQLVQEAAAGLIQELTKHHSPSSSAQAPKQVSLLAQLSPK
jgi:hypothetical protein